MKTGFHDPIEAKNKKKSQKTPWDFEAPSYDDRTRICAGTHFGTGHRNPVGHTGPAKATSPVLPKGRVNTMATYPEEYRIDVQ